MQSVEDRVQCPKWPRLRGSGRVGLPSFAELATLQGRYLVAENSNLPEGVDRKQQQRKSKYRSSALWVTPRFDPSIAHEP